VHSEENAARYKLGQRGLYLSVAAYLLLSAGKIGAGYQGGSQSLIADGWNNISDVLSSLVIMLGLYIAQKPADHDHRYGHVRAETAAALIAGFLMAVVGIDVVKDAVGSLFAPELKGAPHPLAMYAALAGAVLMYGVYLFNRNIAQRTENAAVMAAAHDNRSDALVSVGTAIGIGAAQLGWHWADPLLALLIGLIILRTAWQIGYEAIHTLMDGFDAEKLAKIEAKIAAVEGVRQVLDIRGRHYGRAVHVDVTIGVDAHLTVMESHALTEKVEAKLIGTDGIERVVIHVEPVADRGVKRHS